jgi:twitching motility protein PilU
MLKLDSLLEEMVRRDASDLYLVAGAPATFRVMGKTEPMGEPLSPETTQTLALSLLSERQKSEFLQKREMNLSHSSPKLGRFRVNCFFQRGSAGVVIRQIKFFIKGIDELELPNHLKDIAMTRRGLVIVAGATGSGKSTTLAAMIDYRNTNAPGHIITIEDPIEFVYSHKRSIVTQREVGLDTESYSEALKNALRQAPDVILVGEIRDKETMEAALAFADTGHLCLSTIHSTNANQAIERIITFFPPSQHEQVYLLLSLNLRAIISQRLIPSVDGKRVIAMEILLDTPRVKDLILKKEIDLLKEAMARGNQEGMQTFDQALYELHRKGTITIETATAYADSPNDLRLRVRMEGLGDELKAPAFKLKKPAEAPTEPKEEVTGEELKEVP